jgi:hypothetical protein
VKVDIVVELSDQKLKFFWFLSHFCGGFLVTYQVFSEICIRL